MNIHSSRSLIFLKDDSIHMNITHSYIISWYITIKESKIEKLNHGYLLLFLENTIPIFKKKIRPFLSVLFFFKNNNYHQIWQKIMFFKSIVLYMLCKAIKSREPINNTTKVNVLCRDKWRLQLKRRWSLVTSLIRDTGENLKSAICFIISFNFVF